MHVYGAGIFALLLIGVHSSQDAEAAAIFRLDEQADMQLDVMHDAGHHVMSYQVGRCSCICNLLLDKIKVLSSCGPCKHIQSYTPYTYTFVLTPCGMCQQMSVPCDAGNKNRTVHLTSYRS